MLTREDYVDAAENLNNPLDIMNMLEYILFVLRNRYFSGSNSNLDTNWRARRLMSKIISKSRVMPGSLFLTGLTMLGGHDLIGGPFGLVYNGEYEGKTVALKVLNKTRNNVVCHPPQPILSNAFSQFRFKIGFLPTSVDVAISSSRTCTTVFGDI